MLVKYVHIDDAKTCCQLTLELESFKSWTHLCLDGKPGEMLPYVVLWDHDTLEISSSPPQERQLFKCLQIIVLIFLEYNTQATRLSLTQVCINIFLTKLKAFQIFVLFLCF